jgi:hypothetical protein
MRISRYYQTFYMERLCIKIREVTAMTVGKLATIQGCSKRKTDSVIAKLTRSIRQ